MAGALAGIGGAALTAAVGPAFLGGDEALADPATGSNKLGGKTRKSMQHDSLHNAGVGMHAGPDTAMGLSTFTLNRSSVNCGVGAMGNGPGAVPMTGALPTGLATSGPFAMMMYATEIDRYSVSRSQRKITARGTMRSITAMGNQVVEDVLHMFVAQGFDHRGKRADEFYLHFTTPFWAPAGNPMATKSSLNDAWAMFGSAIVFGEINVG
jgi:hypothetical protein